VQHVGIGQDEVGAVAQGAALAARRVAVISAALKVHVARVLQTQQTTQLILRESFRWVEIERFGARFGEAFFQNRQVVAQRFTAGCARHHDKRFAATCGFGRHRLVRVELLDAQRIERDLQRPPVEVVRGWRSEPRAVASRRRVQSGRDSGGWK
jgi:hypothetical protein